MNVTSQCSWCGLPVRLGDEECRACGQPQRAGAARFDPTIDNGRNAFRGTKWRSGTSGSAIASLVVGILGITTVPVILPILAIVFARKADREIAEGASGQGFASAGRVLGWVGIGLAVVWLIVLLVLLGAVSS